MFSVQSLAGFVSGMGVTPEIDLTDFVINPKKGSHLFTKQPDQEDPFSDDVNHWDSLMCANLDSLLDLSQVKDRAGS